MAWTSFLFWCDHVQRRLVLNYSAFWPIYRLTTYCIVLVLLLQEGNSYYTGYGVKQRLRNKYEERKNIRIISLELHYNSHAKNMFADDVCCPCPSGHVLCTVDRYASTSRTSACSWFYWPKVKCLYFLLGPALRTRHTHILQRLIEINWVLTTSSISQLALVLFIFYKYTYTALSRNISTFLIEH